VRAIREEEMKSIIAFILMFTSAILSDTWQELASNLFPYARGMNCELEITTLSQIQSAYGKTKTYEDGDASEYSKRIHYYVSLESTFVTFDATEVGGNETVMMYSLQKSKPDEEYRELEYLKFAGADFNGIRLGMTKAQALKIFGDFAVEKENVITISKSFSAPIDSYACKSEKVPEGMKIESCDPGISIYAEFEDNKLIIFRVFKFTTT
jgi:hypothetical protein